MKEQRYWVVVSRSQQATHCEAMSDGLAKNWQAFQHGRLPDYVPLAAFSNEKDALAFRDRIAPLVPEFHGRKGEVE